MALSAKGYGVVLVARNEAKLRTTVRDLRRRSGSDRIGSCLCDLSEMAAVRAAVDRLKGDYDQIDILINNAGARFLRHELTMEGLERTLATNHLGHFVLTLGLIDALSRSAGPRIINVSSGVHFAGGVIENILSKEEYDGRQQYADSKLANVLFTYALAERVRGTGLTVNAVGPGGVATNFARNNGWIHWLRHRLYYLSKRQLLTPAQGAETLVFLASSEDVGGVTGKYFVGKTPTTTSGLSYDPEAQERLWVNSVAWGGIDLVRTSSP